MIYLSKLFSKKLMIFNFIIQYKLITSFSLINCVLNIWPEFYLKGSVTINNIDCLYHSPPSIYVFKVVYVKFPRFSLNIQKAHIRLTESKYVKTMRIYSKYNM